MGHRMHLYVSWVLVSLLASVVRSLHYNSTDMMASCQRQFASKPCPAAHEMANYLVLKQAASGKRLWKTPHESRKSRQPRLEKLRVARWQASRYTQLLVIQYFPTNATCSDRACRCNGKPCKPCILVVGSHRQRLLFFMGRGLVRPIQPKHTQGRRTGGTRGESVLPTSLFHCLFVLQGFTRALLHLSDQLPFVFIAILPQLLQQHDAVPSQHVSHDPVCIREAGIA